MDQGAWRRKFKNRNLGHDFASALGTSRDTAKRMPSFDSAPQISVFTLSKEALTLDQGVCRWRFKIVKSETFLLVLREPVAIRGNG